MNKADFHKRMTYTPEPEKIIRIGKLHKTFSQRFREAVNEAAKNFAKHRITIRRLRAPS